MNDNRIAFKSRADFRTWLTENALSNSGLWLVFSKKKGATLKSSEALEEALCFGWIDGQMLSVDDETYVKYFKQRQPDSSWSEKNKRLVSELESKGLMTDYGRAKVDAAKQNGRWNASARPTLSPEQMQAFEAMLKPHDNAYSNFMKMTPSVRKTYANSYFFGAKTDAGKTKRFNTIIERLNLNLNPMESMKKQS